PPGSAPGHSAELIPRWSPGAGRNPAHGAALHRRGLRGGPLLLIAGARERPAGLQRMVPHGDRVERDGIDAGLPSRHDGPLASEPAARAERNEWTVGCNRSIRLCAVVDGGA